MYRSQTFSKNNLREEWEDYKFLFKGGYQTGGKQKAKVLIFPRRSHALNQKRESQLEVLTPRALMTEPLKNHEFLKLKGSRKPTVKVE